MDKVHAFLAGLKKLFDSLAATTDPVGLRTEVGFLVAAAVSVFGLYKVNAPALADSLTALILLIFALGIAVERVVKALQTPSK